MKEAIAILTGGGPAPGMNTVVGSVAKTFLRQGYRVIGLHEGYTGLFNPSPRTVDIDYPMADGIFNQGGSFLQMSRFKPKDSDFENNFNLKFFTDNNIKLLVTVGGDDTASTANRIAKFLEAKKYPIANIHVPKTIDNDVWGTDMTFGFHSSVEIATNVLDCIHTTATSHGRIFCVEIMGHKVGWLPLYAGIAGGADVILLPEIPYDIDKIAKTLDNRIANGKKFSILAVAEGALSKEEAAMKKKERAVFREETGFTGIANRIAKQLEEMVGVEARAVVPGHVQRGGSPSAYDRMLSTVFGVHAAQLIAAENYGQAVAMVGNTVSHNPLSEVAGKTKFVPADAQAVRAARSMGISLGD